LLKDSEQAKLRVQTFGGFRVWRDGVEIESVAWGREKAIHLFQFFVTTRGQYFHKEQIIDRLWPELGMKASDRDFKVALHAINKALEPERLPRAEPYFIKRNDLTYSLNLTDVWIDADMFEQRMIAGNQSIGSDVDAAIEHYHAAVKLYTGNYLPERRYEDWTSSERERLQVLVLNMMTKLADMLVERNPLESIRLTHQVLMHDPAWEDAYRTQMRAYLIQGNRPLALRTYHKCVKHLEIEFGVDPLPETIELYEEILKK
jgi:two-component SAPR family response regulator